MKIRRTFQRLCLEDLIFGADLLKECRLTGLFFRVLFILFLLFRPVPGLI